MKKKSQIKRTRNSKKTVRGAIAAGNLLMVSVFALLVFLGFNLINGLPQNGDGNNTSNATAVIIVTPSDNGQSNNLQLKTFGYITPTPPQSAICSDSTNTVSFSAGGFIPGTRNEPGSVLGFSPAPNGKVTDGKLRIWIIDERPPLIATGQTVDANGVPQGGDTTTKNAYGFISGPQIYIDGATFESGGTPHIPDIIKGNVSNQQADFGFSDGDSGSSTVTAPPIDQDYMQFENGPAHVGQAAFTVPDDSDSSGFETDAVAEYIWDVSKLGSGTHHIEFVAYDGDGDRAAGCTSFSL